MKKKKIKKKTSPKQQKIDVILASLVNLEFQVKELIKRIDQLQYNQFDCPKKDKEFKKWYPEQPILWW